LSREEEAPLIEGARENRAPVTQEPGVMIEASRKHMLALKKMANWVEHELGQLYKEQWPQEELNAAIEQNRQS
jgi:molybdopterin-biosynthesis enzyme MoeA-like protein